jgi:DNA-binding MarR family transcriptional regulator
VFPDERHYRDFAPIAFAPGEGSVSSSDGPVGSPWAGEALERASGVGTAEYLFYLMLQATRRREAGINESLRAAGLTLPKWRALAVIRRTGACAMSELAHLSSVDRTTLTRIVDQLVEDGLVERTVSSTDRRSVLLSLTPAGLKLGEAGSHINRTFCRRALKGVPPEQLAAALRTVQTIIDNLIVEEDVAYGVLTYQRTTKPAPRRG